MQKREQTGIRQMRGFRVRGRDAFACQGLRTLDKDGSGLL